MRGDKTRKAKIYMVTCKINKKRYIGVTTKLNVRRRMSEHIYGAMNGIHNGHFYRAIRKYGKSNFDIFVLMEFDSAIEALEMERTLISNLKPEYNSTPGGEGRGKGAYPHFTKSGREKMAETHRGNKYRLGAKHSDEVKEIIRNRNLEPEAVERWNKFSRIGPKPLSRKVICNNDGKVFESASEASRHYDVSRSALIELCLRKNGRKAVGGLKFSYMDT